MAKKKTTEKEVLEESIEEVKSEESSVVKDTEGRIVDKEGNIIG